jgi:hypothetical protein
MSPDANEVRQLMLSLLNSTRQETRAFLSSLDPERAIHTDERRWRVRDIVGHLAVWNGEAAHSLKSYAEGGEYSCIATEGQYDEYNGPAADLRRVWEMDQVWAEYEASHRALREVTDSMPTEKWDGQMLYPWNVRGTPERLIRIMMNHERVDHCDLVRAAIS